MTDFEPGEKDRLMPVAEAADNYKILVENSLVGIVIVQNEIIVYANCCACELLDCTPSETLGTSVYKSIHPSDQKRVQRYHILREKGRKVPRKYDVRLISKSGAIRNLEFQSMEITYNNKPALLFNMNDVSGRISYANALRLSEERYRILVENNPDLVMVLDDNRIIKANAAAFNILGYNPEELVGLTPWEISPEMQPNNIRSEELCRNLIMRAKQGVTKSFEWIHRKKNGENVFCEVNLVWCENGSKPYLQAIVRDITERKRSDENRRILENQMEIHKRQFYRNTILSFTNGKLEMVEQEEIAPLLSEARLSVPVEKSSDLLYIRRLVENYLTEYNLGADDLSAYIIAVGEALTNAIVHAESGVLYAGTMKDHVWIAVVDDGDGIDPLLIPKATIGKGFSTKPSMGYGFTLMLEVADKILLSTDRSGTAVVLIKQTHNNDEHYCGNGAEFYRVSTPTYR